MEPTHSEFYFFDLKAALEAAVEAMNLPSLEFTAGKVRHLRNGQAAGITIPGGKKIGTLGTLAESIAATYKFRQSILVAELDLSALLELADEPVFYSPLPRF